MAVSKSNNVENIAPSCNSAVSMRQDGCNMRAQKLNQMHTNPDGSKDTAHVCIYRHFVYTIGGLYSKIGFYLKTYIENKNLLPRVLDPG